jgi:hypothetical protein
LDAGNENIVNLPFLIEGVSGILRRLGSVANGLCVAAVSASDAGKVPPVWEDGADDGRTHVEAVISVGRVLEPL